MVRVTDTGVGIPHEMLPRIFDLFTQVETQLSHGGLGIGLALVKDFVALHGGSVQVRSEGVGKGSEFMVRLPLKIQPKTTLRSLKVLARYLARSTAKPLRPEVR